VKKGKYKDVTAKITFAKREECTTRVRLVTDNPLLTLPPCGLDLPAIFWVDFDEVELLDPLKEPIHFHIDTKIPFPDDEILFEATLFMPEEERAEFEARVKELKGD
jgi:hypothetical protein